MTPSLVNLWFAGILLSFFLTACSATNLPFIKPNSPTPTNIPVVSAGDKLTVEAKVVPRDFTNASFGINGKVAEVLVKEGDLVQKGQVIARLESQKALDAAIAKAEANLIQAQNALTDLDKVTILQRAGALDKIAASQSAIATLSTRLANITVRSNQADLDPAAAVKVMKERLDIARIAYDPYRHDKTSEDPVYRYVNSRYNKLGPNIPQKPQQWTPRVVHKGTTDKILVDKSAADYYPPSLEQRNYEGQMRQNLKDELDEAQKDYNFALTRLKLETQLDAAKANLEKGQKDFEAVKDGPDPAKLKAANERVSAAQAALGAAKARKDKLELKSALDGTVVSTEIIPGDQVKANQVAMVLADLLQMFVETKDLTEIDVVGIQEGQTVTLQPDALPGVDLTGTIESINKRFVENRGDVTYTARIKLDNPDPRLRWGMTVLVTILKSSGG
jgi:multidrug efflux pump subunit AcrA (membrane-fusion protein)